MRRLIVRPRAGAPFPRGLWWGPIASPLAVRSPLPPGTRSPSLPVPRRAPTSSRCSASGLGLRLPALRLGAAAGRGCVGSLRPPYVSWLSPASREACGHTRRVLFPGRRCASDSDTRAECFGASLRSASLLPRFARHIFLPMTAI